MLDAHQCRSHMWLTRPRRSTGAPTSARRTRSWSLGHLPEVMDRDRAGRSRGARAQGLDHGHVPDPPHRAVSDAGSSEAASWCWAARRRLAQLATLLASGRRAGRLVAGRARSTEPKLPRRRGSDRWFRRRRRPGALACERSRSRAVVDATHPFADQIIERRLSRPAAQSACRCSRLDRPAWTSAPGDRWHRVVSLGSRAVRAPKLGRRVLADHRAAGRGGVQPA